MALANQNMSFESRKYLSIILIWVFYSSKAKKTLIYNNGGFYGGRVLAVNQNMSGGIYGGRLLAVNQNMLMILVGNGF